MHDVYLSFEVVEAQGLNKSTMGSMFTLVSCLRIAAHVFLVKCSTFSHIDIFLLCLLVEIFTVTCQGVYYVFVKDPQRNSEQFKSKRVSKNNLNWNDSWTMYVFSLK